SSPRLHPTAPPSLASCSSVIARSAASTTGRRVSFVGAFASCACAGAVPSATPVAPTAPAVARNFRLDMSLCLSFMCASSRLPASHSTDGLAVERELGRRPLSCRPCHCRRDGRSIDTEERWRALPRNLAPPRRGEKNTFEHALSTNPHVHVVHAG